MKNLFTKAFSILSLATFVGTGAVYAQDENEPVVHNGEENVLDYVLPDALLCHDGTRVTSIKEWEEKRRPEVMEYFSALEYGRTRQEKINTRYEIISENKKALGGKATMQQVRFVFSNGQRERQAVALIFIPNHCKGKVPVILCYNFNGNHSTTTDESIIYTPNQSLVWEPGSEIWERGGQIRRFPYEKIIARGYAVMTMCYHDIYPDENGAEMLDNSIISLFPDYQQHAQWADSWGAIGAWAWGYSRMADYLETQKWANSKQIVVMGHSRQGKAALWAGAQDKRFSVVISNNSGCSGAALSKRVTGENVAAITRAFPWWFCSAFRFFANREDALPFDQHELIACIAPRPVYVASAQEDDWADQHGEFLGAAMAESVYNLYGLKGLGTTTMPSIHEPIMHHVGYHIRTGAHDVTDYDWERYMDFCDKHFKR